MKPSVLPEPLLEFGGGGRHPDVRFGLLDYGPFDRTDSLAPREIRLGLVGTAAALEAFHKYVDEIRRGVEAKKSNQPTLFPAFPGWLDNERGSLVPLIVDTALNRTVPQSAIARIVESTLPHKLLIDNAVQIFSHEIAELVERNKADVVVCLPPAEFLRKLDASKPPSRDSRFDFHDLLKAESMQRGKTTQLVLPSTYDPSSKYRRSLTVATPRKMQDKATRAWNLYTALYYKASGTPWRLVKESGEYDTCYVGISFYQALEKDAVHTSMAQVFNERGEGVIVRGAAAELSKVDRQPHLAHVDAMELLMRATNAYRREHKNAPARVVVHKSSRFLDDEREGFLKALSNDRIELYDFVWIRDSDTRLFRVGKYPPLRGTFLSLDSKSHLLYTRGSVEFYRTYPGMYVPRPVEFHCVSPESPPERIASEILALTKMNWNNTQFDGGWPITLVASRRVGHVLKYLKPGARIEPRYSYYM